MPRSPAKLEPPDSHHLSSAVGWIELGNVAEAESELAQIAPERQRHPDVLDVRWQAAAALKDWPRCVELAEALVALAPGRSSGWIHRSFALHELGQTQEARDRLLPALAKFPKAWLVRYNLACYACRLGALPEARDRLREAMQLSDRKTILVMARADPDLERLWSELEDLEP